MPNPFAHPRSDTPLVRSPSGVVLAVGTLVVLVLGVAGLAFTSLPQGDDTPSAVPQGDVDALPAAPQATAVSVATIAQRNVSTWNDFSGHLEAVERVAMRSRVAGTVQSVHFREGALVASGDLLVTIDPALYSAEVVRAEAQVLVARSRQAFAKSEHERAQRLLGDRAIAQREYDELANAAHESDANLRGALAELQSARLNLSWTQVRAPVSGRVGKVEVTVGNLVSAGSDSPVLTTLVSVSPIYASFDADEQTVANALQGGQRNRLDRIPVQMVTAAHEDTPLKGHLQWIDNQVDVRSGTVRVRAVFDNNNGALMPGQFARLRMGQSKRSSALLVSERAIGTDQNKKFVVVVDAENKTQWREVTLGANVGGARIVTSGLVAGERVVVNGLQRLRPGMQVAPEEVPMEFDGQQQDEADEIAAPTSPSTAEPRPTTKPEGAQAWGRRGSRHEHVEILH